MRYCVVCDYNPNKRPVFELKQRCSSRKIFAVNPFKIQGRDVFEGVCIENLLTEYNSWNTEERLPYWFYFDNFLSAYEFLKFLKSALFYTTPPKVSDWWFKHSQEITFWIDIDYSIELFQRSHARSKECWEIYCNLRERVPALNSVSNQTLNELFLATQSILDDSCSLMSGFYGLPDSFIK